MFLFCTLFVESVYYSVPAFCSFHSAALSLYIFLSVHHPTPCSVVPFPLLHPLAEHDRSLQANRAQENFICRGINHSDTTGRGDFSLSEGQGNEGRGRGPCEKKTTFSFVVISCHRRRRRPWCPAARRRRACRRKGLPARWSQRERLCSWVSVEGQLRALFTLYLIRHKTVKKKKTSSHYFHHPQLCLLGCRC